MVAQSEVVKKRRQLQYYSHQPTTDSENGPKRLRTSAEMARLFVGSSKRVDGRDDWVACNGLGTR